MEEPTITLMAINDNDDYIPECQQEPEPEQKNAIYILLDNVITKSKSWKTQNINPLELIIKNEYEFKQIDKYRQLVSLNEQILNDKILKNMDKENDIMITPKQKIITIPTVDVNNIKSSTIKPKHKLFFNKL